MDQWASTTDTRVAAAMGTLGVVIRPKRCTHEKTGKSVVRFFMGVDSVDGDYHTRGVLKAWEDGTLPESHPFLVILRTYENRRRLLELANHGVKIELLPVAGAPGIHEYRPGNEGLKGIRGEAAVFKTGDLKMVAALATVGCPLLAIEGLAHLRTFYVRNFTGPRPGGLPPVDAAKAKAAWLADKTSLPWEDPLAQALRGLHNRERLLDVVNRHVPEVVLLQHGRRRAAVRADGSDAAWERAERFLGE